MSEFKPKMTKKYKTLLSAIDNKEKNTENIKRIYERLSITDGYGDLPSHYDHAHIHAAFFNSLLEKQDMRMFPSDMLETYKRELSWNVDSVLQCDWLNASETLYDEFPELSGYIELHELRVRKIFSVTSYNPNAKRRFEKLVTITIDSSTFGTLLKIKKRNTTLFIFDREHPIQQVHGNDYMYSGKWGLMNEFYQINSRTYKRYS